MCILPKISFSQKTLGAFYKENLILSLQKNNVDCFSAIVNNTELKIVNNNNVGVEVSLILCVGNAILYKSHKIYVEPGSTEYVCVDISNHKIEDIVIRSIIYSK